MKKTKLFLAMFGLSCLTVQANEVEVYSKVGLPGVAVGAGYGINEYVSVRADYATLGSIKRDFKKREFAYNAKLKNDKLNLMVDFFPFKNGFRITSGLGLLATKASATGHVKNPINQRFKLGNQTYHIQIDEKDKAYAEIKYPSVSPYLGLGYGHHIKQKNGNEWGFLFDVGVYFGSAKTHLSLSQTLNDKLVDADQVASQASGTARTRAESQAYINQNLEQERSKVSEVSSRFKVLPAVSLGISYNF